MGGSGGPGGPGDGGGLFLASGPVSIKDTTIAGNQVSSDKGGAGGPGNAGGAGGAGDPTGLTGFSGSTGPSGQIGAADGGGIITNTAALLANTIVATNRAGGNAIDVSGTLDPTSFNNLIGSPNDPNLIVTDGTGGLTNGAFGNIVGVADPGLAPLGSYGGPTQTMALAAGSPAINKGVKISGVVADQRGFARPSSLSLISDIGAFQTQSNLVVTDATDATGQLLPLGHLSLRQAVNLADIMGVAATITFDSTAFAAHQTITLTSGQLELSDKSGLQTITGPAAGVTINGGGKSRVFQVDTGVTASLSGLTITGGSTSGNGGGLANFGTLTLSECTISGDSATKSGGGLYNDGTAMLTGCTISHSAGFYGGGIEDTGSGRLSVTDSTLSQNTSVFKGGGIDHFATGALTLTGCTIYGNSAYNGGGLEIRAGTATLTNCTISGNSAAHFGGITGGFNYSIAAIDTIIAGNSAVGASPDVDHITSGSHNLFGLFGGDPKLAPLGDYGGPTQTMALLPGSSAIGQGTLVAGVTTDQRGFALDSPGPTSAPSRATWWSTRRQTRVTASFRHRAS